MALRSEKIEGVSGKGPLIELEFGMLPGGRKTGEPGEKPVEEDENQKQTQNTYGIGP